MQFSGERNTYKVAPLILAAINNSWNYHLQIYNVLGAADKLFRSRIVAFWPIKLTSRYTMAFEKGALKTCANKLLANVAFNILTISLTMVQPKF